MSTKPLLLRSLDPYHQRIGYLGALVWIAASGIDTPAGIRDRLEGILYEKIWEGDERLNSLLSRVPESRRDLAKQYSQEADNFPSAFASLISAKESYFTSALWLCDGSNASATGFVKRSKLDRIIDLGRWTGILGRDYGLTEYGLVLSALTKRLASPDESELIPNLLQVKPRLGNRLFYIHWMLRSESLWPFLIREIVEKTDNANKRLSTRGPDGLLLCAVRRMLDTLSESKDISDAFALQDIAEFRDVISRSDSTADNYLRPRLEILTDIGALSKREAHKDSGQFVWQVTDATRRFASEWEDLACREPQTEAYLEKRFMRSMSSVIDIDLKEVNSLEERLFWFAQAYVLIHREIGFSPAYSISLLGAILAFESGRLTETEHLRDALYKAAKTRWAKFIKYSGGSRFDREILVKLNPGLIESLQPHIPSLDS